MTYFERKETKSFPPIMKIRENTHKTFILSTWKARKCFASYRQFPTKNNWIAK